ncbi:MAG TPA: transposase [Polyangiaceae bacterium]
MRARGGLPPFREEALGRAIRGAVAAASADAFRVIQFSIQRDHLHLIVEAHDAAALSSGMQGLAVRVARAVNRALVVRGRVFRERYHARELETPRAVRNAIVYVLMNARKHGSRLASGVDAFSSAPWFDGFVRRQAPSDDASPVRAPRTWLAGVGWRRRGLVRSDERPAAPS